MADYLIHYRHEGADYSFILQADDWADAARRVRSLKTAELDGEVRARISNGPGSLGGLINLAIVTAALCLAVVILTGGR